MKKYLALLIPAALAGCATNQQTASTNGEEVFAARAPAQVAPIKQTPVSMDVAMKAIGGGASFDIDCKSMKADAATGSSNLTVTISQPNTSDVLVLSAPESQFAENLKRTSIHAVHSGSATYAKGVSSLYYIKDGKRVRINDPRGAIFQTCTQVDPTFSPEGYTTTFTDKVVSLVGPYASVMSNGSGYTGGAHDFVYSMINSFNSEDVKTDEKNHNTMTANPAHLEQVAVPATVLSALKADKFVQKRVGASLAKATTLDGLAKLMNAKMNDCDIYVPDNQAEAFNSFAVFDYPVNKSQMAVRLAYGYGCEAMRGNMTQLGLLVTPTPAFKALLDAEVATAQAEHRKPYFMRYQR